MAAEDPPFLERSLGALRSTRRAAELVWATSRPLSVALGALTVVGGLLPAAVAWTGKQLIDAVVTRSGDALTWLAIEAAFVVAIAAVQRGLTVTQSLLRAQLGHRVNRMILDKALQLDLLQFEDPQISDQMTRARRDASSRPLSLIRSSFGLVQNAISLVTYGGLLLAFSPLAVGVLLVAAVPPFLAETRFAGEAFRLFRWRSPETRKQGYLEMVVAREDYAKEVQLFGLGPELVRRYSAIFEALYGEDRDLTLRRGFWGFALSLLSTAALYGAYAWVVLAAAAGRITLGDMTMYLLVFRQGQSAFAAILQAIGGMYEDNLYLSNLYEFLEVPVATDRGGATEGPAPQDGLRFEDVSFTYPGASQPAVDGITLHLPPGTRLALVGHNGSGKTTLIKLLTRLYPPTTGRITLHGLDLQAWDEAALRRKVGVIFQDFVRYQLTVGENVGAGDVARIDDRPAIEAAAEAGMAAPFVRGLPAGFDTQLGRWFQDGRELSLGQWQKVALSRALMRTGAEILVLDEPTAAMDAEAEAEIFQRLADLTQDQMAVLISHRFSTVRMADRIVVLDRGMIVEDGDHAGLMALGGRYAHLFTLQAQGYQ